MLRAVIIIFILHFTLLAASQVKNDMADRRFRKLNLPPGIKINFNDLMISKKTGVWARSISNGLAFFDGTEFRIYQHSESDNNTISSNQVYDIAEDGEGNVYVATYAAGFNIIHPGTNLIEKFNPAATIPELKNAFLLSVETDGKNLVLLGYLGHGLYIFDRQTKQIRHFNLVAGKPE